MNYNTFLLILIAAGTFCNTYLLSTARWKHKGRKHKPPQQDEGTIGYFSSIEIREGNFLITSLKGKFNIMAVTMTDTQQAAGALTFKDKKLAVTDVPDGAVTLSVADENVATASYEDATNTVKVKANQPGVTALTIKATNKAGKEIPFDDIAIEVTSGDADTGGVAFGEPIEQPE